MSSKKAEDKANAYQIENKKLKILNKELKKQLEMFEKKLDDTLKKRAAS